MTYTFVNPVVFCAAPTAPPQEVSGNVESSSMITFTWSPPPPLDRNGEIHHYRVSLTEVFTGAILDIYAIDLYLSLASLHPFYEYEIQVSAFTVGYGPFSDPVSVITDESGK